MDNEEKSARLIALTKPVPQSAVRQRKDKGKPISYVPWHWVVAQLNEVCGVDGWGFEITHPSDDGTEAVVFGSLSINGVAKANVGFESNNKFWDTAGKRYKSAVSGCVKRCAAMHGIALGLYTDEEIGPVGAPDGGQGTQNNPAPDRAPAKQSAAGGESATEQQLNALKNHPNRGKLTMDNLASLDAAIGNAGLTRDQCASWITTLNQAK